MSKNLKALNKKEATPVLIARLMAEACGKEAPVSLADALAFRQDQYGLKAQDFARIIGMSPQHYSELINGKQDITLKAAKRCFALGIPAAVLLAPSPLKGEI